MLYAEFEAFLVPVEENKESASNTKVRQLLKPSWFACLFVSKVPKFNGEIFTYSGEDRLLGTYPRSGPLRPKHTVRREADEDSNGRTAVETRCGFHLRTVPRSIH